MITKKYKHALDVLAIYSLANIFFAIIFLPIWLFLTNGFSEFNPIYILGLNFESSALLKTLIGAPVAAFYFMILVLWAQDITSILIY